MTNEKQHQTKCDSAQRESYTHGYQAHTKYQLTRSAARDAAFFLPHLRSGMSLLDCGFGPGTITVGLTELVAPGQVIGIDIEAAVIERAREQVTPRTENVLGFVKASEKNIRTHSPDDARLYGSLADFSRDASLVMPDPVQRLALTDRWLALRMRAARLEPLGADHPFDAAVAYLSFGRLDAARRQADRACRLLPNDPWVRAYLAEGCLAYGQPGLARHYLEEAERLAVERGIEQVRPLIAGTRKRLELVDNCPRCGGGGR